MIGRITVAALSLLLACETSRGGIVFVWNGLGADDLWTTTGNWVDGTAPPFDVGDNDIVFGATGLAQSPDINGNSYTSISSIAYLGADAPLTLVDLAGGGSLSFINGGTITNNSGDLQTIDIDLIGTFDNLFITAISEDFDISGGIDLSHTGGVQLTVGGSFDTLLSGDIIGAGASLRKISDGVLTLAGTNTFDGGSELSGGTIVLGNDSALGTGGLSVTADGVLQSNDDARAILNDVGIADQIVLTFSGGNDLTLDGVVSGDGSVLVDADAGDTALILNGDNTLTGGVSIMQGTVVVGNDNALGTADVDVAGDGSLQSNDDTLVVDNRIRILDSATLTFSGGSDLELSGRLFNEGALLLDTDADDVALTLTGASTFSGGTTLMQGTLVLGDNRALGTGAVTVAGNSSIQSDAINRVIENDIDIADLVSLTFSGSENLELEGVISGAGSVTVDTESGNDRLTLSGENTYTGGTMLTQGTIRIGNNKALGDGDLTLGSNFTRLRSVNDDLAIDNDIDTVTFDLTFAGNVGLRLNGDIFGAGGLVMNGLEAAVLTLGGINTYTGVTEIDGGVLNLAAGSSITSSVNVNDSGTFQGAGSMTGDLSVLSGGIVAPGEGIGILTVTGDYLQETGGTLNAQLDSTDLASFDALDMSGAAVLEDAARVRASVAGDGYIPTNRLFAIYQADGGVTTLGGVDVVTGSSSATVSLIADPDFDDGDSVWSLRLTRAATAYSAAANAGNNRAIGRGLDGLIGPADLDPAGDAGDLLGVLDTLNAQQYNEVVTQLSPETYSITTSTGARNIRDFTTQQAAYLSGVRSGLETSPMSGPPPGSMALADDDPFILATAIAQAEAAQSPAAEPAVERYRWGRYVKLQGLFIDQDTTSDRTGYNGQSFGGQIGVDYAFSTDFVAGLALGYTYTNADLNQGLGEIEDQTIRTGPYMSYTSGNWYVDGSATFGYHFYEGDRNIPLLTLTAASEYNGYDITGYVGTGYRFNLDWNLDVTPIASVLYSYFHFDGFTETGAGGANLTVPDRSTDSLRSRLGANISYRFPDMDWQPLPYLYAGWEHEFLEDDLLESSFAAGGDPFQINLGSRDRDALFVGGGVNLLIKNNIAAFFRVEGLISDNSEAIGAAGGISVAF